MTSVSVVHVFWEESVLPKPDVGGSRLTRAIRTYASRLGRVNTIRLYADLSSNTQNLSTILRSELQCSGVTVIDTVSSGRPAAPSKMLIADLFLNAMDTTANTTNSVMLVITADPDIAYTISSLRGRGYHVHLLSPSPVNRNIAFLANNNNLDNPDIPFHAASANSPDSSTTSSTNGRGSGSNTGRSASIDEQDINRMSATRDAQEAVHAMFAVNDEPVKDDVPTQNNTGEKLRPRIWTSAEDDPRTSRQNPTGASSTSLPFQPLFRPLQHLIPPSPFSSSETQFSSYSGKRRTPVAQSTVSETITSPAIPDDYVDGTPKTGVRTIPDGPGTSRLDTHTSRSQGSDTSEHTPKAEHKPLQSFSTSLKVDPTATNLITASGGTDAAISRGTPATQAAPSSMPQLPPHPAHFDILITVLKTYKPAPHLPGLKRAFLAKKLLQLDPNLFIKAGVDPSCFDQEAGDDVILTPITRYIRLAAEHNIVTVQRSLVSLNPMYL
ncbi:hypothetical protein FA15DRAFT_702884 [Coprinopsis marcescibilis]|uniref:NYN domain-containing protein n=1 Tax=Coprinopsis marcescibilis TaxID=230819 RepID=A0A5C3L0J9_COPMA|nr:hypothetical protein FA15DRAFT_702884 [Coprinopsis marcescibilis]